MDFTHRQRAQQIALFQHLGSLALPAIVED